MIVLSMVFIFLGLIGVYHIVRMSEIRDYADTSQQPFWTRWFGLGRITPNDKQAFMVGDKVSLADSSQLDRLPYVGEIQDVILSEEGDWLYTVQWTADLKNTDIKQEDLQKETTKHTWGEDIELFQVDGVEGRGQIKAISKRDNQITYIADFPDIGEVTEIADDEIYDVYDVQLKENNSTSDNNRIIKEAFEYARKHPKTRLDFPNGTFKVGVANPQEDYFSLPSDTKIKGNETVLEIESGMIWFALATGPAATDGVSNLIMEDMVFQAADKEKGAWFMVMANHGYNWLIQNNTFNLVHKSDSHVFDIGGLQNATFDSNIFRGYGPDLTSQIATKSDVASYENHHLLYSEVIQLDASSDSGVWDGNMLKSIDSNYMTNNSTEYLSQYITITNNQFLPYYDDKKKLIAYSGTLGQHSTDVGIVTIANNHFENSLVNHLTGDKSTFYFDVIHLPDNNQATVSNNIIN